MLMTPSAIVFIGGGFLWNSAKLLQGSPRQLTHAAAVAMLVVGAIGFAVATLLA
ncbi:hypothetical protein [Corynebacterium timonense]|nr:hypothetical protein [Corynebacterium timonense]